MDIKGHKIAIAGAGLVGSALAALLQSKGAQVDVYEKRKDPRLLKNYEGRSINLALSDRGIRTLDLLGVTGRVLMNSIPMKGRMIHDEQGSLSFLPYSTEGKFINSVSRAEMNKTLVEKAEELGVRFHFDQEVFYKEEAFVLENDLVVEADFHFGVDGAFSKVRAGVDPGAKHEWLTHSYKELHIDPRQHEFAMEPNALHIWPRGTYLLIALPNADKSFTATLILPNEGDFSFDEITNDKEIKNFFEAKFPDSIAVIKELEKQFKNSPTSKLATVRSDKWYDGHSTLLLGDAAHGIIPFYGQGMNAGLEDCSLLMELISSMTSWDEVASSFAASRPKDAAAIAQLSINNFVEMRDKVADEQFLLQKKIERKIHDLYPAVWVQLYTMVTFSHIPYSVALAKGDYQNKVMKEVLKITNVEEKVNAGQLQEVLEVLRLQGVEVE